MKKSYGIPYMLRRAALGSPDCVLMCQAAEMLEEYLSENASLRRENASLREEISSLRSNLSWTEDALWERDLEDFLRGVRDMGGGS